MNLLLPALLGIALLAVGWFWFEGSWDRRLFAPERGKTCINVRPRSAMELIRTNVDLHVLDIRSRREFAAGALPRAANVSIADKAFCERIGEMDRTRPVLVYCAGGYRSRKAVGVLRALGFQSIYHLHRGYHSWRLARLPVVKANGG